MKYRRLMEGGGGGSPPPPQPKNPPPPTPLPYYHRSHVSQPKIGQSQIFLKTSCSIQGVRFLPSNDSRSTMKQDRFSLCLNNRLLMLTQLSITDSMDSVKIFKRVCLCQRIKQMTFWEIGVGLCAWLSVRCAPTLFPFLLSFKTLRRFSKASSAFTLG